eukprot:CAMPEP_0201697028 /NCGR_PEP_ID=MMETSP0578-20130828/9310_1 /ASSEMBLY_ACC=CAM_ASM_000663 /TAXON_ID=267565 /ORGANISM="Skeletonema grethea, Strain CCMP 1804" /LENGTH=47 /DNA_ID= /DNA_START= /DNA_END= /DNA_ORIENTATION=
MAVVVAQETAVLRAQSDVDRSLEWSDDWSPGYGSSGKSGKSGSSGSG